MNIVYLITANINAYDFLEMVLKEKFNILMPEIKKNIYGKPYFEKGGIYFNISHSGGLQAVAVGDCEVGVDLEKLREVDLRVARRFTEREYDYVMGCDREYRFVEVWTKKEAYLKYKGTGISGGFKSFDVFEIPDLLRTFTIGEFIVSVCSSKEFKIEVVK